MNRALSRCTSRNAALAAPILLALSLIACSTQRSSETQTHYTHTLDTITEEGSWTIKTWEYAPVFAGIDSLPRVPATVHGGGGAKNDAVSGRPAQYAEAAGPLLRYSELTHDPSKTTTASKINSSGSSESESKTRPFGIFALLSAGWPYLLGAVGASVLIILRPGWLGAGLSALKAILQGK